MKQDNLKLPWVLLIIFAAIALPRWYYVENYTVSLPYYDQWDAEGYFLLKPWIQGKLLFSALWQPHNEHRIFPTRLFTLLVYEITGHWNNLTMVRFNILIAALTPVLLTSVLFRSRELRGQKWIIILVIIAGTALPFSWENIVTGFQNQFYFLVLFTICAFAIAAFRPINIMTILAVSALSVLCVLTMASGIFTAAATAAIYGMRSYIDRRLSTSSLVTIVLLLMITILGYITMPVVRSHEMYRPQSVFEVGKAVIRLFTWPLIRQYWAMIPLWFPACFSAVILFYKKRFTNTDSLMTGISIWVLFQIAAIAYGRGQYLYEVSSRYTDLISVGITSNAWFVLRLKEEFNSKLSQFAAATFFAVLAFGYISRFNLDMIAMKNHYESGLKQMENVKSYLITKNKSYLFSQPKSAIPYPDPERLQLLLDDIIIQSILPPLENEKMMKKAQN